MSDRTFVLEFNVAKLRDPFTDTSLEGEVAEFRKRLRNPAVRLSIIEEYPVLARILTQEAMQWSSNVALIIERYIQDAPTLEVFFNTQLGRLNTINIGMGDHHNGGQTVCTVSFESGVKMVYKPRSLGVDEVVGNFTEVLAKRTGIRAALPRTLDRGEYGWAEFISHSVSTDRESLASFYREAGALIATLFCLGGGDIHYENLIASGGRPYVVDLECLFQPFAVPAKDIGVSLTRFDTVLGSGLLPGLPFSDLDRDNLCGLGDAREGALWPLAVPLSEVDGRDNISIVKKRLRISKSKMSNLPSHERGNGPQYFVQEISEGFREHMQAVLSCRTELMASRIWQDFCKHKYRHVLWPTMGYGRLLLDSYHPNVLRNAMDREVVFDRLYHRRTVPAFLSAAAIASERHDLWNGDIPVFHFDPNDGSLWDSRSLSIVNDNVGVSAVKTAENRITALSDEDIERHIWTIVTSLKAAATAPSHPDTTDFGVEVWKLSGEFSSGDTQARIRKIVREIGFHVAKLAFCDDLRVLWVDTIQTAVEGKPRHHADLIDEGLYSGLAGFLLFFQYASLVLGEPRFEQFAQKAAYSIIDEARRYPQQHLVMGGFLGWSSALYALSHRLAISQTPELVQASECILDLISSAISDDKVLDIIGGSAGTICTLLTYFSVSQNHRALELAHRCGDHLIASMIQQGHGVGWKTIAEVPVGGFAHGTAGIAYSLYRLALVSHDSKFLTTAMKALEFERSTYSPELNNWQDLRPWGAAKDYVAWCGGAPGVGVTLAAQIGMGFADDMSRRDVERAFAKTLHARARSYNVCHGELGNLDCLHYMAHSLEREEWIRHVDERVAAMIVRIAEGGLEFDAASQSLGLMLGLSGVGLTLLRFCRPELVPSFLVLEPPKLSVRGSPSTLPF